MKILYKQLSVSIAFYCLILTCGLSQSSGLQGGGALKISQANITCNFTGIEALYANPAAMVRTDTKYNIDLSAEQRFNLQELSVYSGAFLYKASKNAFGVSIVSFGDTDYSERKLAFSYGRSLLSNLSIGANFHATTYNINQFGNKTTFSFDVGAYSVVTKQVHLSAHISNPISVKITDDNQLPSRLNVGLIYIPSGKIQLTTELEKLEDRKIAAKLGILYALIDKLQLRMGYDISRAFIGAGISYSFSGFKIAGGMTFNDLLGSTPGINLQYRK